MGTFDKNMSPNILVSFFCLAVLCSSAAANFVKRISDTEYEIKLNQTGAFFSQKVTLDKQQNLVITEVPAHHNIVAIKNIFDASTGLAMKVIPSLRRCHISRPFMSITARDQEDILAVAAFDESEEESLEVSSRTAKTFNLAQLEGPELDFECVPEKFQKFVPEGYLVILAHEVQVTQDNFQMDSKHDNVFFTDPITQKKYNYGDHVELWSEIFDFAPECKSKRVKRQNGGFTEDGSYHCRTPAGTRVRCYGLAKVECEEGCDASETGYDCSSDARDCYFVLICSNGAVAGEACLAHLSSEDFKCTPCCRVRNCGTNLQKCKYAIDNSCPVADEGCPWPKVVSDYDFETPSNQTCQVDESCDTVVSGDGDAIGSGIACRRSTRRREYKRKFCCKNPTPSESSELPTCIDPAGMNTEQGDSQPQVEPQV